jgi:hypothetical protein
VMLLGFPTARMLCKIKAKGSKGVDIISGPADSAV